MKNKNEYKRTEPLNTEARISISAGIVKSVLADMIHNLHGNKIRFERKKKLELFKKIPQVRNYDNIVYELKVKIYSNTVDYVYMIDKTKFRTFTKEFMIIKNRILRNKSMEGFNKIPNFIYRYAEFFDLVFPFLSKSDNDPHVLRNARYNINFLPFHQTVLIKTLERKKLMESFTVFIEAFFNLSIFIAAYNKRKNCTYCDNLKEDAHNKGKYGCDYLKRKTGNKYILKSYAWDSLGRPDNNDWLKRTIESCEYYSPVS